MDILTFLQVQDYNSGSIMGLDNQYHSMGGADFHVAMLDMLLSGFPVAGNTANMFPAMSPSKVLLGIPATTGAGNGYVSVPEVEKALNYIVKGQSFGGSYVLRHPSGYPTFGGMMTWSINWDAFNGIFEFSNNYRPYLDSL
jgi:chitinase